MAKKKKKWIQGAIKHPGSLRRSLKAKKGKNISSKRLTKATRSKNLSLKRKAVLARTLRKFARKRKKKR